MVEKSCFLSPADGACGIGSKASTERQFQNAVDLLGC